MAKQQDQYIQYIFKDGQYRLVAGGGAGSEGQEVLVVDKLPEQAPEGTVFYLVEDSDTPTPTSESKDFVFYKLFGKYEGLNVKENCYFFPVANAHKMCTKGMQIKGSNCRGKKYGNRGLGKLASSESVDKAYLSAGNYSPMTLLNKIIKFTSYNLLDLQFERVNSSEFHDKFFHTQETTPLFHAVVPASEFTGDIQGDAELLASIAPIYAIGDEYGYAGKLVNASYENKDSGIRLARYTVKFIKDLQSVQYNQATCWSGNMSDNYIEIVYAMFVDATGTYFTASNNIHIIAQISAHRF